MNWLLVGAFCIVSYLIGAIPFSFLFVKWFRGVDLRAVGSGNLGSTNAMRVLGTKLGLVVQALDIVKGFLPAFILTPLARVEVQYAGLAIGLAAVVGHMFPVYLGFRGGKGVNTSLGVFLALTPKAMLVAAVVGVSLIAATRIVSVGSICGAAVLPFAVGFFYPRSVALIFAAAFVSVLVIYLHRSNIRRLLAGTESRIGRRASCDEGGKNGDG
jgi:glycerol-3-phosphate acyltransferase PlsY